MKNFKIKFHLKLCINNDTENMTLTKIRRDKKLKNFNFIVLN